jgi:hypothetical protein
MSLLSRHLKFDATHKILICPIHELVVLPSSVRKHFDKHHCNDLSSSERQQLQTEADEMALSQELKMNYTDFAFSQPDGEPLEQIPYLGLHPAIGCTICGHICTLKSAEKNMKEHLRVFHKLYTGTESNGLTSFQEYTRSISTQRYFNGVTKDAAGLNMQRFFEVTPTATMTPRSPSILSSTTALANTPGNVNTQGSATVPELERLQSQLAAASKWANSQRAERLGTVAKGQSVETNPWLSYTRFTEIIPDRFEDTLRYTEPPRREMEPTLYLLYCTAKSMVRTWQNSTAKTSRYARIRIMQEDTAHVPLHPLETYQNMSLQHALPLQKVFLFFYRVLVQGLPAPSQLNMTPTQTQLWNNVVASISAVDCIEADVDVEHCRLTLSPLEAQCHLFWLSLVEQTSIDEEFELTFIIPVAYQVVSSQTKRLREVYNFATDITALKKMVRLSGMQKFREVFVQSVQHHTQDNPDGAITHLEATDLITEQTIANDDNDRESRNRTACNEFQAWVRDYLTTAYPTPMNWLINTARYLSRFRYGENMDAFVTWNGDTVSLRGIRTSLPKYASMVHNEYERASALMCRLMFVSQRSQLPSIPWDSLVEDPSIQQPGFSVFSPESAPLREHESFVQQQLIESNRNDSKPIITELSNARQIKEYCDIVQEFLEALLGLVHFTSGQPARGTELLSVHHENPPNGMLRNVFLYQGLVAIVPQYHKGYNRDKSLKVVYRFLPRAVGSLLVWYLWLIRPFYTLIQHSAPESVQDAHLGPSQSSLIWSTRDGSRHVTSKLLQRVVERATEKWMGQIITVSKMRHLIIAFGRKVDGLDRIPTELSKEDVDEIVDAVEDEERETQAGHSGITARAVYALDISSMFSKKFDKAQGQFKVSSKWHQSLGFDVEKAFDDLYPTSVAPLQDSAIVAQRIQANYRRLLKDNFGKEAVFRPLQESVVRAIMSGESVVAYIAGTGAGKSLAFLLPACYPGYGQAIVLVPLASLRTDIVAACHGLRITVSIWMDGYCDQTASIILATPECLSQPAFVDMAHRLSTSGRLERIVVDEFHYVLLPDHKYRPHLLELRRLTKFGARLTLLSATIPFLQQVDAFRLLGLPTDIHPFRVATSRPNLVWQVQHIALGRDTLVADMAAYVRQESILHDKTLVYVDTIDTAKQLSTMLGCHVYHGKMTLEERLCSQEAFRNAPGIMVATAAYLVGVHVPDIGAVLKFALPDHLINHVQGGGRGGRNGKRCIVRILLSPSLPNLHYDKADRAEQIMVDAFVQLGVQARKCRRRVLDEYMDNDTRLICRTHEEPCDICHLRMTGNPAPGQVPEGQGGEAVTSVLMSNTPSCSSTDDMRASTTPVQAPNTPSRSATDHARAFTTPVAAPNYTASTPASYELSASRPAQRHSIGTPIHSGSPTMPPRRLPFSPPKRKQMPTTCNPPARRLFASSASSDDIYSAQSAAVSSTIAPLGQPSTQSAADLDNEHMGFLISRQNRELEFHVNVAGEANANRGDLFKQQLPATQLFWTRNCVVCFCARKDYDHARDTCRSYVGSKVTAYRTKMGRSWGDGMCWSCLMPANCCPRWSPDGTGRTVQHPDSGLNCIDKRAIQVAWVFLWSECPGAKARWLQRIRETQSDFDPDDDNHFRKYFGYMHRFGDDYKASNLCLDVNWLTQSFFLHGNDAHQLLSTP